MAKKIFRVIAVLCILLTITVCFVACGDDLDNGLTPENATKYDILKYDEATVFIFKANTSVCEITEATTLKTYLDALSDKKLMTYSGTVGAYGLYITSVNGETAGLSQSWFIYTDDAQNSSTDWGSYAYDSATLGSANSGVSELIVKQGAIYALVLQSY